MPPTAQNRKLRCLVTGGLGFIGSHLVTRLVRENCTVRVLDGRATKPPAIKEWSAVEVVQGQTQDHQLAHACMKGVDWLFHFASSVLPEESNRNPTNDIVSTLAANVQLITEAAECGVKKIVFASSGGTVYGCPKILPVPETHPTDPISSYGIVKLATEKYLALFERLHGLPYVALRYSNPYGEGQDLSRGFGAIATFLGASVRGEPLHIWGDGLTVRDFVYIDDAIEATFRAAQYSGSHKVFNVGTGEGTSINDLVKAVQDVTGVSNRVVHLPARSADAPAVILDVSKAARELHWYPGTRLDAGIARTWKWCQTALSLDRAAASA